MTRSQGFARGDLDTAFPLDDKFIALRGLLTPERYYAAVGVYFTVVAATWREAERKLAVRVAPDAPALIEDLVAVGLFDGTGRVSTRAFTSWIGRARRNRKSATDRQARNRAGLSREVTRDSGVTSRESRPARVTEGTGKEGTSTNGIGGVQGGAEPHIEAWLMARHRLPTQRQRDFLDRYLQVFDVTGPQRMAELILTHPDDPIAALKADLDEHRERRFGEVANWTPSPKPKPKLEPWQELFRQKLEADEAALVERTGGTA